MLTVMDNTEKMAVGFTQTLPCPMLLGQDWPYFYDALNEAQDWRDREASREEVAEELEVAFFRGEFETQGLADVLHDIDLEEVIGENFREEQAAEPMSVCRKP